MHRLCIERSSSTSASRSPRASSHSGRPRQRLPYRAAPSCCLRKRSKHQALAITRTSQRFACIATPLVSHIQRYTVASAFTRTLTTGSSSITVPRYCTVPSLRLLYSKQARGRLSHKVSTTVHSCLNASGVAHNGYTLALALSRALSTGSSIPSVCSYCPFRHAVCILFPPIVGYKSKHRALTATGSSQRFSRS